MFIPYKVCSVHILFQGSTARIILKSALGIILHSLSRLPSWSVRHNPLKSRTKPRERQNTPFGIFDLGVGRSKIPIIILSKIAIVKNEPGASTIHWRGNLHPFPLRRAAREGESGYIPPVSNTMHMKDCLYHELYSVK